MGFGDLKSPAGLQLLNSFLADKSYIEGYVPSQADVAVFEAVGSSPPPELYHALRWYNHIKSYDKQKARATQDRQIMVESSDKTLSTGEGNGNPPQYPCQENPMDNIKRLKDMTPEDEPLRLEGVQCATGEERRAIPSSSRKSEVAGSKPKGCSVMDASGSEKKVRCCKEYCIGTWNVRSMNQSKLDVVKHEMTRLNIDILGISELKWTGMGEFNSDDHCIYYCGQETLRKNGVALIVNGTVRKAVIGYNLKNDRMISVRIQGKPLNITVIQVYAPTTDTEEVEVDRFYEDLQHLLKLTPKKDVLFIIGDWNATVGSQEIIGITGRFGLGVQNEAGQRLIEFCQENKLVIANTLFQQHKRRLYTWTSPDGQYRNQIDYVLCSQRWRSSIQSAKTRPGADCGSDHKLLIAKFRLKLKNVGKTTRPFSLPGVKKALGKYGPADVEDSTGTGGDSKDDDDIDLFGSDEDEESEEAKKLREERLAQYESKKAKKPALVAKSSILLDVKPWDDETDMAKLEECVRSIQADGLVWGSSKLVPVGYGIKKLQIQCVVEDDKVGTDMLEEKITAFEDYVQSMDVAAFNKI